MAYRQYQASEHYCVVQATVGEARLLIWDIVTDVRNAWHRYQHAQLYDTVEHREAFRNTVVFGLRRFAEEGEGLLAYLAVEIDRTAECDALDPRTLVAQLSAHVKAVRPRIVPPGLRYTLLRYLEVRWRRPEEIADDELRVLAVGLWGVWDRLEDSLREFEQWLAVMGK